MRWNDLNKDERLAFLERECDEEGSSLPNEERLDPEKHSLEAKREAKRWEEESTRPERLPCEDCDSLGEDCPGNECEYLKRYLKE
jgi:hypothetical protein